MGYLRLAEFRTSQNRGEIPRRKSSQIRRGNIADKAHRKN